MGEEEYTHTRETLGGHATRQERVLRVARVRDYFARFLELKSGTILAV